MKIERCPNETCEYFCGAVGKFYRKKGYFVTKWNAQPVPRYRCGSCGRYFSSHSFRYSYRQKKPFLNLSVFRLYSSSVTLRRMALVLGVNRKTVVRKTRELGEYFRREHRRLLDNGAIGSARVQFDEMETFEHTRLKPLSIALAVDAESGTILSAEIATIKAKGRLADIARKKYGHRPDTRNEARVRAFADIACATAGNFTLTTDRHPAYASLVKRHLPKAKLSQVKTRGEIRFLHQRTRRRNEKDLLFRLNHTAAKIRHDLSRMARKVWVTTKKAERLKAHLDLYIAFHNRYNVPA